MKKEYKIGDNAIFASASPAASSIEHQAMLKHVGKSVTIIKMKPGKYTHRVQIRFEDGRILILDKIL